MQNLKSNKINGVFEGGGVKGSAFVGAIEITESKGYVFENLAGTSAGSVVAALLAAGYNASALKKIMDEVDYTKFEDAAVLDEAPLIGMGLEVIIKEGIYKGNYVEKWLADLLASKGIKTFKDLIIKEYANEPQYRYRLQVIASDITNGNLLVFPNDAKSYGINPDDFSVAKAIRMSISIPFFYEPVILKKGGILSYIVDGGILSNYPVWIFDSNNPGHDHPTFGYKLVDPSEGKPAKIDGPIDFFKAMFGTMMEAHDARYIKDHDFTRTIPIPTLGIQTTDFGITLEQKDNLYKSGKSAANKFFNNWNFNKYKKKISDNVLTRTQRVWGDD